MALKTLRKEATGGNSERRQGRIVVTYAALAELLGLPAGHRIIAIPSSDMFAYREACEILIDGGPVDGPNDRALLPSVKIGDPIPALDLVVDTEPGMRLQFVRFAR